MKMTYEINTVVNENSEFIGSFNSKHFEEIYNEIWSNVSFQYEFEILEDGKWIGNQDDVNTLEYFGYAITPENIKNKLITIEG
jgi:hypothetical protein